MLNIPEYKEYGGETKIALMDNSSLAFMHELSQRSYPSDGILSVYDLILIPKWVMEEIEDSTYRSTYVEQLQAQGYPIRWIDETKYGAFVNDEDRSLRRLWTEHGAAYRMDESKFEGVTKINDHEFELHNAHCFKIDVPQIGSAQAIYYDVAALKTCCEHIRKNHIPHPIVYIMACRIGPFAAHFYKEIHKLGGIVFRNPDGECEII